jgi:hypothetical protein
MDKIPTVIPGLTRDPETIADWIPAFAGMTFRQFGVLVLAVA